MNTKEILQKALNLFETGEMEWKKNDCLFCAGGAIGYVVTGNHAAIYNYLVETDEVTGDLKRTFDNRQLGEVLNIFNGGDKEPWWFNDEIAENYDDIKRRFQEVISSLEETERNQGSQE